MQRHTDVSVKYEMCPRLRLNYSGSDSRSARPITLLACTLPPFRKAGEDFINKNKKVVRDDTSCGRDGNLFSVLFLLLSNPIVSAGEKCDSFLTMLIA